MVKNISESKGFTNKLAEWSKKHPFMFWGLIIIYIISPIDLIPFMPLDDIIVGIIAGIVGVKKLI